MTGFTSVGRLKEMSVGEVKIDPSFVAGVTTNPDTELIVRSAVHLLRGLGIRSVAEGVESPQVASALRGMGCVAAQGWQFSRPLDAAAATAWLAHQRPAPVPRRPPWPRRSRRPPRCPSPARSRAACRRLRPRRARCRARGRAPVPSPVPSPVPGDNRLDAAARS